MLKLLISFLAVFTVIACEPKSYRPQIDFDLETFKRERKAWLSQDIAGYSYEVVYESGSGSTYIRAQVTVADGTVAGIESLIPETDNFPPNYNDDVVAYIMAEGGTVSGIYERIYAWYNENAKKLDENQQLHCKMKYNSQYHYPEYVEYGISTFLYTGNNTWTAGKGVRSTTLELSDFQTGSK